MSSAKDQSRLPHNCGRTGLICMQCDEKMPACSHCLKKQIVCRRYKPQFDLAWRNQNVVAEQSVRRRKRAEEREPIQHKPGQKLVVLDNFSFPSNVSQDFEGYAVSFFLTYYVCLPRDPGDPPGFLECLYPAWTNASKKSPLVPAVTAVSSIMLETWSQILPAQPLSVSRQNFTKAIEALPKSLQDSSNVIDKVLLAALMLHMYENMKLFFFPSANVENHFSMEIGRAHV